MTANPISERIRRARMAAGLQGKDLATRLGISRPYLSQIEKGDRTPSEDLLNRLAKELQTTTHWLLFGNHTNKPKLIDSPRPPSSPVEEKPTVKSDASERTKQERHDSESSFKARIADLERQLERANETIASQARTIEAMQQGRRRVAPVSGACGGDVDKASSRHERRAGA